MPEGIGDLANNVKETGEGERAVMAFNLPIYPSQVDRGNNVVAWEMTLMGRTNVSPFLVSFTLALRTAETTYTEKLEPQPQPACACGLVT